MNWLKEITLVLIIGSWAVLAAYTEENINETPRVIGEENLKLFAKPWNILSPTTKPTTIIVKPYPVYPKPNPDNNPTITTRRPNRPRPSRPNRPSAQRPPFGYYPIYSVPSQPLPSPNQPGQQRPTVILVYQDGRLRYQGLNNNGDRFSVRSFLQPLTENEQLGEAIEQAETQIQDQENYNESDAPYRELSDEPLVNDSEEETDSVAIDGGHIKLPFGIQLVSEKEPASAKANKKFKHQEALIYLKNVKQGRKLQTDENLNH